MKKNWRLNWLNWSDFGDWLCHLNNAKKQLNIIMLSKTNRAIILTVFSIFYIIAVGLHIYEPIVGSATPLAWHLLYIITYGACWGLLFSKYPNRQAFFGIAALFPFFAHLYIGYQQLPKLDSTFWICALVCIVSILGYSVIKKL
jgi:hypothetical protein